MRLRERKIAWRIYARPSLLAASFTLFANCVFPVLSIGQVASPASPQFVAPDGLSVEELVRGATVRSADLLAARQRLAIAEGRVVQAGLRPNPVFDTEYGSPKFLAGESESDFSAGISQTFELGGKRGKRKAVAELELQQVRSEVFTLERKLGVDIRQNYTRAIGAARQLDIIERLLAADAEMIRITEARLNEGDVAPLELNLVKVESDRLRVQQIEARTELETALLELRTLIGIDVSSPLRLAPQAERPPRLDLGLTELTNQALSDRADLQAARIGESLGAARINLARSGSIPNVAASVRFSRTKGIIDLPDTAGGGFARDLDNELTFGVSIEIPVFNRNQGEIASATGEQIQAVRTREFLEASIRSDVAVAYRQYRSAAEKLVLYSTQILPRAETNLQTVRSAYNAGEFSMFEVIAEQRRLVENVTGFNKTLREYYTALGQLEAAVGAPLPSSAFTPGSTSVLPDKTNVPRQFTREDFLKPFAGEQGLGKLGKTKDQPKQEEKK